MIQPTDFVNQAKKLIDSSNSPTEVDCRTAVSRAYYFLFHQSFEYLKIKYDRILVQSIEDYLTSNGGKFNPQELSKLDGEYLKTLNVNLHSTIPNVLRRLRQSRYSRDFESFRDDRNIADYQLSKSFLLPDSITKVNDMERLAKSITVL